MIGSLNPQTHLYKFLVGTIVLYLASCTGALIDTPLIPDQIKKLRSTNRNAILLTATADKEFNPAGHQYLFFFIPFGRIQVKDPQEAIYNKAYTKLAVRGYNVMPPKTQGLKTISISLKDFQLTAYDILLMRRIYCLLDFTVTEIGASGYAKRTERYKVVKSAYKAMAFKAELSHIYEQCLDQAVNQAFDGI